MNLELLILLPLIITMITAYLVTPLIIRLTTIFGLIDDPEKNHHPKVIHTVPTPRGGGLAIFIAVLISTLIFLPLDKHVGGILIGGFILIVMGLVDDKYDLNPYLRFVIQIIAGLCPVIAGIGISFLSVGVGIIDLSTIQIPIYIFGEMRSVWLLADIFAVIWIVAIINFTNMGAKGIPGQLPGVAAIAALTIALLSLRFSADITEWPVTILASITAGAFLGFLPYNTFPQRIMPAFSGSNFGGYLLAILAILSTAKVGTLFVVMSVPIIDTSYTMIRRILHGKSPFWGDRGHLHHRLLDHGWSQLQVTLFYWGITAALGIATLYLNASLKLYTIIGVSVFLASLILLLSYRPKKKS